MWGSNMTRINYFFNLIRNIKIPLWHAAIFMAVSFLINILFFFDIIHLKNELKPHAQVMIICFPLAGTPLTIPDQCKEK